MNNQFWDSFFASMPGLLISLATLVTALGGVYVSIRTSNKLAEVKKDIDGRMGELLDLTAKSSKAEGVKQEVDKGKSDVSPQEVHVVNSPADPIPVATVKTIKP